VLYDLTVSTHVPGSPVYEKKGIAVDELVTLWDASTLPKQNPTLPTFEVQGPAAISLRHQQGLVMNRFASVDALTPAVPHLVEADSVKELKLSAAASIQLSQVSAVSLRRPVELSRPLSSFDIGSIISSAKDAVEIEILVQRRCVVLLRSRAKRSKFDLGGSRKPSVPSAWQPGELKSRLRSGCLDNQTCSLHFPLMFAQTLSL
jgi:hypothetical protein